MSILTLGYDQNTMICHAVSTLKPKVSKTNLKEKNKEKKIKWKKKWKKAQGSARPCTLGRPINFQREASCAWVTNQPIYEDMKIQ